jgi:hypothetical protein
MLKLLKQEHNDSVPRVFSLAVDETILRGIVRNFVASNKNVIACYWGEAANDPFATVTFREGVNVRFFVERADISNDNEDKAT